MKRYMPGTNAAGAVILDGGVSATNRSPAAVVLAADVAPLVRLVECLLPLFEERAAGRERTGVPLPDEITLTARFSVADLRAAVEVLQ